MKRPLLRLLIALVTFFVGVAVKSALTGSRPHAPAAGVLRVEPPAPRVPTPPADFDPAPAAPEFVLDYDPEEFNPRGDYFILGRKPKEFRQFDCFELVVEERDGRASGVATLLTKYFGKSKDYYILAGNGVYSIRGFVTKERLYFVAAPESGEDFEFRFDGRFLRGGTVSRARGNEPVLKGTLTKLKDGLKVAEREVRFRVEYIGC